jgi:hypothetical protein
LKKNSFPYSKEDVLLQIIIDLQNRSPTCAIWLESDLQHICLLHCGPKGFEALVIELGPLPQAAASGVVKAAVEEHLDPTKWVKVNSV